MSYEIISDNASKVRVIEVWLFFTLLLTSLVAVSEPSLYQIHIQNPNKNVNYIVGDKFSRVIELKVKTPYKIALSSLPSKGLSVKGLELNEVRLTEKQFIDSTNYKLQLDYQVFSSSPFVKKIGLPAQTIKIAHISKSTNITIPAWFFRVSPIATHNETYIEQDMSPYRSPLLVSTGNVKTMLAVFLGMSLLGVLGLVYINADKSWFPGMGGPFSASHRHITKLDENKQNLQKAVASIHQAFNKTFGENLFEYELEHFFHMHPTFTGIKVEIIKFFSFSNEVLFESDTQSYQPTSFFYLLTFCEQCRHCERGLL